MYIYQPSESATRATPCIALLTLTRVLVSALAFMLTSGVHAHDAHDDDNDNDKTSWPGGRWEPGPAKYGVQIITNVPVPMADGLNLNAVVAYPTDLVTGERSSKKFPVLVQYTPYVSTQPARYFIERGYISVTVWARGTGLSPGVFTRQGPQDRVDGVTIVDWASKRDGSNGDVGMMGCSYVGNLALGTASAVGRRSPLKAIAATCAGFDAFPREIFMRGAAITRTGAAIVAAGNGYGSPTQPATMAFLQSLQDEIFAGGPAAYLGKFWADRGTLEDARAIVDNDIATLLWSSWGDITISGALNTYAALQSVAAGRPRFGPWAADVYDPMDPRMHTSGAYQIVVGEGGHGAGIDNAILLEWFDTFLKNQKTGIDRVANTMHLRERTRWINAATYPLVNDYTALYLGASGNLSSRPAPAGGTAPSLLWDARPEDANGSVVYISTPFAKGATLAGPIAATIHATSTNTNLQLIATLHDVAPDGTATFIADGVLVGSQRAVDRRKSWYDREGLAMRPVLTQAGDDYLIPGKPHRFDILLQPRLWPIEPGHSLRLTLTTRPSQSAPCTAALSSTPCFNSAPQLLSLSGGAYTILADIRHRSSVNLPLLRYHHFKTTRSAVTETSPNTEIPMDWGPENEGHRIGQILR